MLEVVVESKKQCEAGGGTRGGGVGRGIVGGGDGWSGGGEKKCSPWKKKKQQKQENQTAKLKQQLPSGVTRVSFVSSASVWGSIVWRSSTTPAAAGATSRRSQFTFTASQCSEGIGRISRGTDGETTETLKRSRCFLPQEEQKPRRSSSAEDVWHQEMPPSGPNCIRLLIRFCLHHWEVILLMNHWLH